MHYIQSLLMHSVNWTQVVTLHHAMWTAPGEIHHNAVRQNVMLLTATHLCRLTLSYLSVLLSHGGNGTWRCIFKKRVLFCHWMSETNGTNGKLFKILIWIFIQWVKYRICSCNLGTCFPILAAEKLGCVKYVNFFCVEVLIWV
jgi:hypothetical protein